MWPVLTTRMFDPKVLFVLAAAGALAVLLARPTTEPYVTMTSIGMYFKENPKLGKMFSEAASKLFDSVQEYACFLIAAASATLAAQLARNPAATLSCSVVTATAQNAVQSVLAQPSVKDTIPPTILADVRTNLGDLLTAVIRCSGSTVGVAELAARLKEVQASLCYKAKVNLRQPGTKAPGGGGPDAYGGGGGYGDAPGGGATRPGASEMGDSFFNALMGRGNEVVRGQARPVDRMPLPARDYATRAAVTRGPVSIDNVSGLGDEGDYADWTAAATAAATTAMGPAAATVDDVATFAEADALDIGETFLPYDRAPAPAIPVPF